MHLLLLKTALHLDSPRLTQASQPSTPKFIDVLLSFNLNQSHTITLLCLEQNLTLCLLLDTLLVLTTLPLGLLEKLMVGLSKLSALGANVAGPSDAYFSKYSTIGASLLAK